MRKISTALASVSLAGLLIAGSIGSAPAGEYEVVVGIIEAEYGVVTDPNSQEPGTVDYSIVGLTLDAKEKKAAGDDAGALASILAAEALLARRQ